MMLHRAFGKAKPLGKQANCAREFPLICQSAGCNYAALAYQCTARRSLTKLLPQPIYFFVLLQSASTVGQDWVLLGAAVAQRNKCVEFSCSLFELTQPIQRQPVKLSHLWQIWHLFGNGRKDLTCLTESLRCERIGRLA